MYGGLGVGAGKRD